MKIRTIGCSALLFFSAIHLGVAQPLEQINAEESSVRNALPEEYAEFQRLSMNATDAQKAQPAIRLCVNARVKVSEKTSSPESAKNALEAYRGTWRMAIRTWRDATDAQAKQTILSHWNASLQAGGRLVAAQLYALSDVWNRDLLTPEFWLLLRKTKDKAVISAISYVLYLYGTKDDAEKLLEKEKALNDSELQEIVQNALNWIRYSRSGNTNGPGPAAAPPHPQL